MSYSQYFHLITDGLPVYGVIGSAGLGLGTPGSCPGASAKVDIKKSLGCMSYYLSYFVSYVIITLFSTEINR